MSVPGAWPCLPLLRCQLLWAEDLAVSFAR
jgi:hypothetical protein